MSIVSKIKSAVRLDGWFNLLSSLGVRGKDKRVSMDWDYSKLTELDVETLYASDDVSAKLVDKLPEDAFREGWEHKNISNDLKDGLKKKCEQVGVAARLKESWQWARLYGGSGIYMNVNDGLDPQEPVDEENIQDVTSLTVLSRYELIPYQINSNIESPYFGEPAIYRLQTSQPTDFVQRYIHHSRILRFDGDRLPRRLRIQNQWWGQSIYVKTLETVKDFHTAHKSSIAALADFSVGVVKMKNLGELLQTDEGTANVKTRMEIMAYAKSVLRMIVLDETETFDYVTRQLNGVKDIVEQAGERMVGASKMPHTILLGEGAQGLGSDGKSEQRDWYDSVANEQELILRPRLDTLFRYLFLSKRGLTGGVIPGGWTYEFEPLWQLDAAEAADVRLKTSQADQIDIQNQVLDANEVAESRYGGSRYSTDTKLNDTLRNKVGAAPALNPPPLSGTGEVKPSTEVPPPDPKLVSPAQDPYNPQGPRNGALPDPVLTPDPGFMSRTDETNDDGGPGSGPQGGDGKKSKGGDHEHMMSELSPEQVHAAKEKLGTATTPTFGDPDQEKQAAHREKIEKEMREKSGKTHEAHMKNIEEKASAKEKARAEWQASKKSASAAKGASEKDPTNNEKMAKANAKISEHNAKAEAFNKASDEHHGALKAAIGHLKSSIPGTRHDDSDGIIQEGNKSGINKPRRVLQSIVVHKHTVKNAGDARDLAQEYGGRVNGVDESTDAFKFRQRHPDQLKDLKGFSPPKHPHVTLVYGEEKDRNDDSRDTSISEPTFEQANKNYQALWSWSETPNCGPDGSGCLNVQQ